MIALDQEVVYYYSATTDQDFGPTGEGYLQLLGNVCSIVRRMALSVLENNFTTASTYQFYV